jgi:hypothetical protein
MTALDDFLVSFDRRVRRLVLPIYYGLAIVADLVEEYGGTLALERSALGGLRAEVSLPSA